MYYRLIFIGYYFHALLFGQENKHLTTIYVFVSE